MPGRLVPVEGTAFHQEIRFPRPSDPVRGVTLGSAPGEPPDHVTIGHPSLVGRHARLRFQHGHWWIQSLGRDAPVVLNDRVISSAEGPRHLKDGDRVRLGSVDFHFFLP